MFRSVWQSCRAQSRDCRGGTQEEEREARAVWGRERNKKTREREEERSEVKEKERGLPKREKSSGSTVEGKGEVKGETRRNGAMESIRR